MWLSSFGVRGIGEAGEVAWDRVDALGSPVGPRVDALRLLVGGLDPTRATAALAALGWAGSGREPSDAPDERAIERPWAVRAALDEHGRRSRAIQIEASFSLDPPLFGRVREAVLRDPQLAGGLGDGALTARVGWRFTPDLAVAAIDRIGVALGEVAVPPGEAAAWSVPILSDIAGRIAFLDASSIPEIARRLSDAAHGPDPARREGARRAMAAFGEAPFGFGGLEIVRVGDDLDLAFGESLRPLRWVGDEGVWCARLLVAVLLDAPDVLVVPHRFDAPVAAWLADRVDGDDASLEQVLRA